jgi:surface polysaccharide O-acyltransferase-like enzyme
MLGCVVAYNALVFVPKFLGGGELEAVLWVISCVASCFGFLAMFRGMQLTNRAWMNSLSRSAYVMYLVHYVFVLWTQRLALDWPVHAGVKFLFVFLATTLLSWLTAQVVLRVPRLNTIL